MKHRFADIIRLDGHMHPHDIFHNTKLYIFFKSFLHDSFPKLKSSCPENEKKYIYRLGFAFQVYLNFPLGVMGSAASNYKAHKEPVSHCGVSRERH